MAASEEAGRGLTYALAALRISEPGEDNAGQTVLVAVEVAQATGIVMGALNLPPADVLSRLKATVFVAGCRVTDIAADVVAGRRKPGRE